MTEASRSCGREAASNVEAFAASPWGEQLNVDEVSEYLGSFYESEKAFVYQFKQGDETYLYIHGKVYDSPRDLLSDDFTGEDAFHHTSDSKALESFLGGYAKIAYLANAHADKDVAVSDEQKPRMRVLPGVLSDVCKKHEIDAIVLYTHRKTGVYAAVQSLDPELFRVKTCVYTPDRKPPVELNEQHEIDELVCMAIEPVVQ